MNNLAYFLLYWVWQFPQMALGAVLAKVLGASKRGIITKDGRKIIYRYFERNNRFSKIISGVSLAAFILLPDGNDDDETVLHEHGHSIQSLYLGWLYLPVIGLPSLFNNLRGRVVYKDWTRVQIELDYYSRYPEKEADKLGGVQRG